jgi:hypothetical protein
MMKASLVHYNHQTGIVTAEPHPSGEKYTVTEDAAGLEVTAGDDVAVSVDAGMSHVEAMTDQPLLIREEGETVAVLTARKPAAADQDPKAD